MEEITNVILGVSLGTRTMGLAVGNQRELIEWRTKAFKETYSRKKVKRIWRAIELTIERYGITAIGMKLPHKSLRSEGLNHCLAEITKRSLAMDIPLFFYDIKTIELHFLKSAVMKKSPVADIIAEKYPFLKREHFRLGKSKYTMKIFEAVAVLELALLEF